MQNNKKKSTVISFAGDLSFSAKLQKEYLNEPIDQKVLDYINDSNAVVINYESPITSNRNVYTVATGIKKRLKHRTDPEAMDYIKSAFKNPYLSFANNHMNDLLDIGIIDTIDNADAAGIKHFGSGRNLEETLSYRIIGDDVKVGIFSFQYKDFNRSDKKPFMGPIKEDNYKEIQQIIDSIKAAGADYTVAFYHGGTEFLHYPEPDKRKRIKKYLDMGCDVVVAHHPHVVQGYEYYGDKLAFYSLGNFYFDTDYQRSQADSDKGIIIKVTFGEDGVSFETRSIKINRDEERTYFTDDNEYFINIEKDNYKSLWSKEKKYMTEVLAKKDNFIDDLAGAIFAYEDINIPRVEKLMTEYEWVGDFDSMRQRLAKRQEYILDEREAHNEGGTKSIEHYRKVLDALENNDD